MLTTYLISVISLAVYSQQMFMRDTLALLATTPSTFAAQTSMELPLRQRRVKKARPHKRSVIITTSSMPRSMSGSIVTSTNLVALQRHSRLKLLKTFSIT